MKYKKWLQKEPYGSPMPVNGIGGKKQFLPIFFVKKLEEEKGLRVRVIEPAKKKEKSGRWMVTARSRFFN